MLEIVDFHGSIILALFCSLNLDFPLTSMTFRYIAGRAGNWNNGFFCWIYIHLNICGKSYSIHLLITITLIYPRYIHT